MKKISLLFLLVAICSCSNSDNSDRSANVADVTVLLKDGNDVLQVDLLGNAETTNVYNLSQELGFTQNYNSYHINFPSITFIDPYYVGNFDSSSLFQKNVTTSETFVLEEVCSLMPTERNFLFSAFEDQIFVLSSESDSTAPFGQILRLKVYDKQTGNCSEVVLGSGENSSMLVKDDIAYVSFRTINNQWKIMRVNSTTSQIEQELLFSNSFSATVLNNELHVFDNFGDEHIIYSASSFDIINTSTFSTNLFFQSGLFSTKTFGNELLTFIAYPQPGLVSGAFGTIDIDSGEFVRGNNGYMYDVRTELSERYQNSISFTAYDAKISTNEVVLGIQIGAFEENRAAVVYSNFDGEITKVVEIEAAPFQIIIR